MGIPRIVFCAIVVLAAKNVLAESALPEKVAAVLERAAPKLGAEFQQLGGVPGGFAGSISRGLETCDRLDLHVQVHEETSILVLVYPCVGGERLNNREAADRTEFDQKLAAASPHVAPFAWMLDAESVVHARKELRWDDATTPDDLERLLLAAPTVDKHVPEVLAALRPPLSDEELKAKLREAGAADEARRAQILKRIAPQLPELTPSATVGQAAFEKIVMNGRGAAFDAFRFRVPGDEGERRLVWAFAYPPGTAKGWFIAPVGDDAPKFVKFHRGGKYEGTNLPAEHATLLQRSDTPLRAGAEYVIWFQFKVETPVDMYVALGCFPFAKSDRDTPAALEAALGLKPAR